MSHLCDSDNLVISNEKEVSVVAYHLLTLHEINAGECILYTKPTKAAVNVCLQLLVWLTYCSNGLITTKYCNKRGSTKRVINMSQPVQLLDLLYD